MKIPGLKTLKLYSRWLRSKLSSHALILGYHRVADVAQDPYQYCVSPGNFAEQLEVLVRHTQVISLAELVDGIRAGQLPERAVALTFDDGYVDNYQHARPLLEAHQLPGTVFVVTGSFGCQYWWDRLEAAFFTQAPLHSQLALTIAGVEYEWSLTEQREGDARQSNDVRAQALMSIYRKLLNADPEEREKALLEIESWAGVGGWEKKRYPRAMTSEEVIELSADGLIEIGSHTASHLSLTRLPPAEQRREITDSKSALENLLGRSVSSFSYPNGAVSKEAVSLVQQAGYQCACTSINDVVRGDSHVFQLPRFWIPDWDGVAFERWLWKWGW